MIYHAKNTRLILCDGTGEEIVIELGEVQFDTATLRDTSLSQPSTASTPNVVLVFSGEGATRPATIHRFGAFAKAVRQLGRAWEAPRDRLQEVREEIATIRAAMERPPPPCRSRPPVVPPPSSRRPPAPSRPTFTSDVRRPQVWLRRRR